MSAKFAMAAAPPVLAQRNSPPLEARHPKSEHSHDSGTYLDWSPDDANPGEFVTVVSIEGAQSPGKAPIDRSSFVTVLSIGNEKGAGPSVVHVEAPSRNLPDGAEEVSVYRLPGERLGFGLKFEGGSGLGDNVRRLLIQSCAPESPASRAACSWGSLREGDEILEIDGVPVNSLTKAECVHSMKESRVVMRLVVRRPVIVCGELKKASPPPIPPRKTKAKPEALPPENICPPSGFADLEAALMMQNNGEEKLPLSRTSSGGASSASRYPSKRASPLTPRACKRGLLLDLGGPLPPDAELYTDLLSLEGRCRGPDSESDDTGSSLSTVVALPSTSNSSLSLPSPTTSTAPPLDLARVLGPFEQLERELAAASPAAGPAPAPGPSTEGFLFPELQPPPSFQDAPLSYGNEEVRPRALDDLSAEIEPTEACRRKKRAPPPPVPPAPPRGRPQPPQPAPRGDKLPRLVHCVPKDPVPNSETGNPETDSIPEPLELLIERQRLLDLVTPIKSHPVIENSLDETEDSLVETPSIEADPDDVEVQEVMEGADVVDGEITLLLPDLVIESQADASQKDPDTEDADDTFSFRRSMSSPLATIGEDEEDAEQTRSVSPTVANASLTPDFDAGHLILSREAPKPADRTPIHQVPDDEEDDDDDDEEVAAMAEELVLEMQKKMDQDGPGEDDEDVETNNETATDTRNQVCNGADLNNNLDRQDPVTVPMAPAPLSRLPAAPPSGSRLPPDGDEFPPRYHDPLMVPQQIANHTVLEPLLKGLSAPALPLTTPPVSRPHVSPPPRKFSLGSEEMRTTESRSEARAWRQDERSERSVRDKIAMFTSAAAEAAAPAPAPAPSFASHSPGNPVTRRLSNKFKSSEDVFYSQSQDSTDSTDIKLRSTSTVSIDRLGKAPDSATTLSSTSSAYSSFCSPDSSLSPTLGSSYETCTLPRKARIGSSSQEERPSVLSRATSFNAPRQAPTVPPMSEETRRASLTALVEQRRKSISKLRGLVIPDKVPEAPSTILDLPEIRSRDSIMIASSAEVLLHDTRPKETPVTTYTPTAPVDSRSLLTSPPWKNQAASNLPKYSPAFKRKSLTLRSTASTTSSVCSSLSSSREELRTFSSKPARFPSGRPTSESATKTADVAASPTQSDSSLEFQDSRRGSPDFRLTPSPSKAPNGVFITETTKSAFLSDSGRSAEEESDNDSAVSSSRSSISHGFSPPASPLPQATSIGKGRGSALGNALRRTLSADTTSPAQASCSNNVGSNKTHNMENGKYQDSSRRVLKARSVDAINRNNVLFSARYRSGRNLKAGSPLMQRKESSDEDNAVQLRDPREEIKELERMVNSLDTDADSTDALSCDSSVHSSDDTLEPTNGRIHYRQATLRDMPAPDVKVAFLNGIELDLHPVSPTTTKPLEETQESTRPPPTFPKPLSRKSGVEGHILNENSIDSNGLPNRTAELDPQRSRTLKKRNASDPLILDRNTSPVKNNSLQAVSVNDIRKAFEKAELALSPTTLNAPSGKITFNGSVNVNTTSNGTIVTSHGRGSSIDSTTSEEGFPGHLSREQFGSITSLASTTSLISQQELQQLIDEANQTLEEANSNGINSSNSSHEVVVVILHRETAGASVGITLAGGADYETKEITVHKVLSGSPAERDGRLQKGDRILSINGRNMKGVTHRESLAILKAPRPEVVLVVSRSRGDPLRVSDDSTCVSSRLSSRPPRILEQPISDGCNDSVPRGPPVNVMLKKDGAGLGFSLEGGKDSPLGDRPLTIKKIFTGGCAEKNGQLQAGDELLSVNNTDVTQMSRIEAWGLMKRLQNGSVTLCVRHACVNAT